MGAVVLWWFLLLIIGAGFMPLSAVVFRRFEDRGWMFSKMIGFLIAGWALWALTVAGITEFTGVNAVSAVLLLSVANYAVLYAVRTFRSRQDQYAAGDVDLRASRLFRSEARIVQVAESSVDPQGFRAFRSIELPGGSLQKSVKLIAAEEILFLGLMLAAFYIISFRPEAYGTEKFMDYGFLTAMQRSTKLPFEDPWFAGESVNYYYGGQYLTAFLMKMSGISAGYSYNLMRALITAMSFVLPFSLVYQMVKDHQDGVCGKDSPGGAGWKFPEEEVSPDAAGRKFSVFPVLGGVLSGIATAFAGNGHYLIYGIFMPILAKIRNASYSYWFPNSTRYIGYDPDVADKTIHEFPSYSSVLGDLHAHYINLIFVITICAIMYAWAEKRREAKFAGKGSSGFEGRRLSELVERRAADLTAVLSGIYAPEVLLAGFFTGIFRWTNAADFAIFFVVCGSILFFTDRKSVV